MKILFVSGDEDPRSPVAGLAGLAKELIGKDAEVLTQPLNAPLLHADGVWIFTDETDGGCPEALRAFLEANLAALARVPVTASGVGGKDGGMNAVNEIAELFGENGSPLAEEDPFLLPLRTQRISLDAEERMDLFWHVDEFLTAVERSLRE